MPGIFQMGKLRPLDYIAILIAFGLCIAAYLRLYYGVDYSDEPYYIALPYRFILGDRPFIDEYALTQLSGLLLYPFYKIYYLIVQGTEGIILYGRHLFYLFYLSLACLTYKALKTGLDRSIALLIACACIFYIPFNIYGLSYNTLTMFFFLSGTLLVFLAEGSHRQNILLAVGGGCFSLSAFSYPSLAPCVLLTLLIIFLRNGPKCVKPLILGFLPVTLGSIILISVYHKDLGNVFQYMLQAGYGTGFSTRSIIAVKNWKTSIVYFKLTAAMLSVLLLLILLDKNIQNKSGRLTNFVYYTTWILAITLPLLLTFLYIRFYFTIRHPFIWYFLIINLSLLAAFYYPLLKKNTFVNKLMVYLWLPSFFAGITYALSSGNGFLGAMVGFLPAFLVTLTFIYLAIERFALLVNSQLKILNLSYLPLLIILFFLATLLTYSYGYIYLDEKFSDLDTKMTSGPYKFLSTTAMRAALLTKLQLELKFIINEYHPNNMIVYPGSSAFYLYSNLKPRTNSVWLINYVENKPTLEYLKNSGLPEVSLVVKDLVTQKQDQLLNTITSESYIPVLNDRNFAIFIARSLVK